MIAKSWFSIQCQRYDVLGEAKVKICMKDEVGLMDLKIRNDGFTGAFIPGDASYESGMTARPVRRVLGVPRW
jgi:hypothetical protein